MAERERHKEVTPRIGASQRAIAWLATTVAKIAHRTGPTPHQPAWRRSAPLPSPSPPLPHTNVPADTPFSHHPPIAHLRRSRVPRGTALSDHEPRARARPPRPSRRAPARAYAPVPA